MDASALVLGLLNDSESRLMLATEAVAVPHLADVEVTSALRSQVRRGMIGSDAAGGVLDRWAMLGVRRFAAVGLLGRIWALRENLSACDATYVALAEAIGCELVTADARLAGAPGPGCPITVVAG